ncbi:hypothetical protein AAHC63_00200 [Klebsiella quasipneumoniae subsp. quasipneumoniae]|uniref:hypothetical protein n=1 Tax=Klebsiella quasipneumoniae TaxID=1463165 RepID=UPI0039674DAA
MIDITELAQSLKAEDISSERMEWLKKLADMEYCASNPGHWLMNLKETNYLASLALQCLESNSALVEALEKAQLSIAELESRTVKLPDGWQFEECEIEGCENGAIFSIGTGSRNIHLCDKCAHEPQNSRLKKSPLSKRLPFKMSAGIKVEAE